MLRARSGLLLLLAVAVLLAVLVRVVPERRADAAVGAVPRSVCAQYDRGVRTGVCVQDGHGGIYWLGTLRGYDGVEMYCIDYLFATDWSVAHHRDQVTGPLLTSLGRSVDAATRAALTYVVTRYPASSANTTTAAAIGLIIRQVMGDVRRPYGQTIPGGLTVRSGVRDVSFVPNGVVSRARQLWSEARVHRGAWSVAVKVAPGAGGRIEPGEHVTATVRGRNGSGAAQDMTVMLTYTGFTGPASVRLGADGTATVGLVAPALPGAASLLARVSDAPSPYPVLIKPNRWHVNQNPGHSSSVSQRGLVGRQATVVASDRIVVEVHYGPAVSTTTSSAEVRPGAVLTDQVRIAGADPTYVGPVSAALHGPFRTPPSSGDCVGGPVAGTVTLAVRGDGTYTTPGVTVAEVGYYTWVESLPGTPSQDAVTTPCGAASETTLVTAQPQITTQTSKPVVEVGAGIFDRVRITGLAPGYATTATARLYGPFPSRDAAVCTGKQYATVAFRVTRDGDYVSPTVTLRAAGYYTWVESLPDAGLVHGTVTGCGLVTETTLAKRTPPVPHHPDVPAGGSGWILR